MIQIFRKIRLRMLKGGSKLQYVKYALGEIILVVAGILIALQINNWNEDRKDRIQEQKILRQLSDEFRLNLNQIDNKIQLRENIIKQSAEVLAIMDAKKEVDLDTLLRKISVVLLAPTFDRIKNEELDSDRIQLIRNDSLRRYLNNWSSRITNLKEQENEWVNLLNNYTIPYFIDLGISRNVNISFYQDPKNMAYLYDKSRSRKIRISKSEDSPSASELISNRKLEGILANAVLLNEGINWESEAYRILILDIIRLIENETNRD